MNTNECAVCKSNNAKDSMPSPADRRNTIYVCNVCSHKINYKLIVWTRKGWAKSAKVGA